MQNPQTTILSDDDVKGLMRITTRGDSSNNDFGTVEEDGRCDAKTPQNKGKERDKLNGTGSAENQTDDQVLESQANSTLL